MKKDWRDTLENLERDEIIKFATITMGMLSVTDRWLMLSCQELFDHIMSLVEKEA